MAQDPQVQARRPPADVVVTPCPDGPLLVRGDVTVLGGDGKPLPRRRQTVALCRCGYSAIKPWCDGSHKAVGFSAPG
jgi:CDGSH-type Zn-finger protein